MKKVFAAVLLAAFAAPSVGAYVVDFETPGTNNGNLTQTYGNFTFNFSANGWGVFTDSFSFTPSFNRNGSTRALFDGGSPATLSMARTDGAAFSLTSFDSAALFGNAGGVVVTGNLIGGGSITTTLDLTGVFQTFTLSGYSNLQSVVFADSASGTFLTVPGVQLDNLSDAPIDTPEPAMIGLFGLGAIGLGLSRRRKI